MTVQEVMERTGMRNTTLTIQFIKDALLMLQSNAVDSVKTEKQNIISDIRDYKLPADEVAIKNVSVLDTGTDQYETITRIDGQLIMKEDASP